MHIANFFLICSQTPLHYAAQYNHHGIAVTLLKYGASAQLVDNLGMSMRSTCMALLCQL